MTIARAPKLGRYTSRGAPRDVRREGYKGLPYRSLYTIFFATR
jgi:hypothetical protein